MKPLSFLFVLATLLFLAACSQAGDSVDTPATAEVAGQVATTGEAEVVPATSAAPPAIMEMATVARSTSTESETIDESARTSLSPTATVAVELTESALTPIEVTYFTPAQMEGPYYTVDKPEDRDNDLTVLQGNDGTPAGEIVEFTGKLYDATGMPVPGVIIEIWQTDNNGIYLHPNDPDTDQRDTNFQFYGEAVTAVDGSYRFRTILPGHYEPRPRHIHVKVRYQGQELLTTQFYFAGDPELASEPMFSQTEGETVPLIISLTEGQDDNGHLVLLGQRDIILNVDLSGS